MAHQLDKRAFKKVKNLQPFDSLLIFLENPNQENAGNVIINIEDFSEAIINYLVPLIPPINVSNGLISNTGVIQIGGNLIQNTSINLMGNDFIIQDNSTPGVIFGLGVSQLMLGGAGFARFVTMGGITSRYRAVVSSNDVNMAYTPDINNNSKNEIRVDSGGTRIKSITDLQTDNCLTCVNNIDNELFKITSGGQLIAAQIINYNYPDDTIAAANGIQIGGIYHSSGNLKIRLI